MLTLTAAAAVASPTLAASDADNFDPFDPHDWRVPGWIVIPAKPQLPGIGEYVFHCGKTFVTVGTAGELETFRKADVDRINYPGASADTFAVDGRLSRQLPARLLRLFVECLD